MALGIDVYSRYQNVRDWHAVRNTGYEFAWVKLSDGTTTRSEGGYTAGGRAAGVAMGGYHYAQPGNARHQADIFIDRCEYFHATDLAPALDMEHPFQPNATAVNFSREFLHRVVQRGHRPALYANNSMMSYILPRLQQDFPNLVRWVARYPARDNGSNRIRPSITYDVHQFSQYGRVPGISASSVDLNDGVIPHNHGGGAAAAAPQQEEPELSYTDITLYGPGGPWLRHVNLPPWDKISEAYLDFSSGFAPVNEVTVWIYRGRDKDGNKMYPPPSWCNYGKPGEYPTAKVSLDTDDVIRWGIPDGTQSVSISYTVSGESGAPACGLYTRERR